MYTEEQTEEIDIHDVKVYCLLFGVHLGTGNIFAILLGYKRNYKGVIISLIIISFLFCFKH